MIVIESIMRDAVIFTSMLSLLTLGLTLTFTQLYKLNTYIPIIPIFSSAGAWLSYYTYLF